jgi:uncharacterized protein
LTGEAEYEAVGAEIVGLLAGVTADHPTSFAYMLGALERVVTPSLEVAIVGDGGAATAALRREVVGRLLPAAVGVTASADAGKELTPLLAERGLVDGQPAAYVCEHFACRLPVTTPEDLRAQLDEVLASRR